MITWLWLLVVALIMKRDTEEVRSRDGEAFKLLSSTTVYLGSFLLPQPDHSSLMRQRCGIGQRRKQKPDVLGNPPPFGLACSPDQ